MKVGVKELIPLPNLDGCGQWALVGVVSPRLSRSKRSDVRGRLFTLLLFFLVLPAQTLQQSKEVCGKELS